MNTIANTHSTITINHQNKVEENKTSGKFSTYLPSLTKVRTLTIASLAILALASIPCAEAGPIAYASCMAGCSASGPFAVVCWPACLAALASPLP